MSDKTPTSGKTGLKPPYFQYVLIVLLLLLFGFQQTQITGMKASYKKLDAERFELVSRVQALELQNEELLTALKQIDSRVGYMDSKVEGVIEENVEKARQYRAEPRARQNPSVDAYSEEPYEPQGEGLLEKLGRFFN